MTESHPVLQGSLVLLADAEVAAFAAFLEYPEDDTAVRVACQVQSIFLGDILCDRPGSVFDSYVVVNRVVQTAGGGIVKVGSIWDSSHPHSTAEADSRHGAGGLGLFLCRKKFGVVNRSGCWSHRSSQICVIGEEQIPVFFAAGLVRGISPTDCRWGDNSDAGCLFG